MNTLLFCPALDDRYGSGKISTRVGLSQPAISFDSQTNLYQQVKRLQANLRTHCILIDEAQFLNKSQVQQLCRIVDELDIPVLTYGLRSDFQGEPFEGSLYLLVWADHLHEIKTICHCGRKATMNLRIDAEGRAVKNGEKVLIGGNDQYVATCRQHFSQGLARSQPTFTPPAVTGTMPIS
jgi:thymidine kinase